MSLLDALYRAGQLRTLDHALAQSLRRLDPDTPDAVLAAAALASLAVSKGHAGFRPDQPSALVDADIDWPAPDAWRQLLVASPWVSTPDDADQPAPAQVPLVLEGGLLHLRRYREYERRLVAGLRRIGAASPTRGDLSALSALFLRLFPGAGGDDRQARAAAVAVQHSVLLVTGGPGTGKTTTITRLLVLLVAQARLSGRDAPRIALAAPTGRAAERMAESVRHAVQALADAGVEPALCEVLPQGGSTLHRLLGTLSDSPRFRHDGDHPLPFDVVVVDEASMIDLPLMAKLVEAVPDGARLVLLGDPDQLPSVEAGDVLSGILRAAGSGDELAEDDAEALSALTGGAWPMVSMAADNASPTPDLFDPAPLTPVQHVAPGFPGRRVHLRRGWRQSEALQLAPLAEAVRSGDGDAALALLRSGELGNVQFHEALADPLLSHREPLLAHWRGLADAASPADALARASQLRLLTAVRDGPQGARSLNARVEEALAGAQRRAAGGHFHGRLLLITENSYRHGLFNGDIGICFRVDAPRSGREPSSREDRGDSGPVMAWFPGSDPAQPRAFHPAALPAHESAFAMTVHKAQGSEFDSVWLLLPTRANRVLSRELIYTGLTRARHALHIAASEPVLREALARHASRWSGLAWRLAFPPLSLG